MTVYQLQERQCNRVLYLVGAAVWIWSGWHPYSFSTWLLEQVASFICLAIVLWLSRSVYLNRASRTGLLVLFCLHTIGTHYTYSLTPYAQLMTEVMGSSPNDWFGWERNHYDRIVHFAYGFCSTTPITQALQQRLGLASVIATFFCANLILASSALYELAEWGAAVVFGGDVGTAYLGTQGDVWDAQADIALAGIGWFVAYCLGTLLRLSKSRRNK